MIKIEIYPLKNPDELSTGMAPDVDFEASPQITVVLGWVMGNVLYKSMSGTIDLSINYGDIIYDIRSLPCLMAIVELDGKIQQIEHYRVKILKEE